MIPAPPLRTVADTQIAKVRKNLELRAVAGKKNKNIACFIWKFARLFVSLQRQNNSFDYPVSFRVGARLYRHYSILKQRVTSCDSFVI